MITDKNILISSPIFLLSPGEKAEVNLKLEKFPIVQETHLEVFIKKKRNKIIVKGKTEPHTSIEVDVGDKRGIKTTSDCKGFFKVKIKKYPRMYKKKLMVTVKAQNSYTGHKMVTIIVC